MQTIPSTGAIRPLLTGAALLIALAVPAQATTFAVTNLVTNDQTLHPALIDDPNLKNGWGISRSGTSPFWVSDNGAGVSTLYSVNPTTNATTKVALTVTIPGNGSVTGQVFNSTTGFNGDRFLFVSEDGTVSGWRPALGTVAETLVAGSAANVYKGTTSAIVDGNPYLYSANFHAGTIDVLKGVAGSADLTGTFTDPGLPAGYAPFNIQILNGKLYVTYALQDGTKHDEIAGAGNGYVDVFDLQGNFLGRVGSNGALDAPWGLAIAPNSFGEYAGDLLVGNFGDGTVDAFNLGSNSYVGQLKGTDGNPLVIDGLWGLSQGNNGSGGSPDKIYFSAGPDDEVNGLFGVLTAVPEPATITLLGVSFTLLTVLRRRA
jgi:uncharacterized protein (TIGR03118 family)